MTTLEPALGNLTQITVVIPCYNSEKWVGRAIKSVLAQEELRVEVIAIDDGSTDGSLDVIRSFGDHIRCEAGPNRGACAARNRGLALASAPYVMFLDADDWISPQFLKDGIAAMTREEADIGFGPLIHEEQLEDQKCTVPNFSSAREAAQSLFGVKFFPTSTCLIRTDFISSYGGWDESLNCRQDVELFARLLSHMPRVCTWRDGRAIYGNPPGPRISTSMSFSHAVCTGHVLFTCKRYLQKIGFSNQEANRLLCQLAHGALLRAARQGDKDAYRLMRRFCAEIGHSLPEGTRLSRLGYFFLGVRTKEQLSDMLKKLKTLINLKSI